MILTVAATGHREERFKHDRKGVENLVRNKLKSTPTGTLVCGMANGFDLIAGDIALELGLDVIAARPWATHGPRESDAEVYEKILEKAKKVVNISDAEDFPGNFIYQKRNEWMVDHCDVVMAYWDLSAGGGTYNCINYAKKVKKPVANVIGDPPF